MVSGTVAGIPEQGGATWAVLQYVLGLRRLGHDVFLVEMTDGAASPAVRRYFDEVVTSFGLDDRAVLWSSGDRQRWSRAERAAAAFARGADLLINISGTLRDERLLERVPVRVYIDVDPGFTQFWHEQSIDMGFDEHTHFVTVGLAIGLTSPIPTCGRRWITSLPPVVLDHWPVADAVIYDACTTVTNWRGYGSIDRDGLRYGQKAHSLRALIDLPSRTDEQFVLALDLHPHEEADIRALDGHGWRRVSARRVAGTPERYRGFVQGSKAELGVAKSGYVLARSGWFSDRSACYLASGRPVVAQDTGFSGVLPVGEGLHVFDTVDDVLAALDDINGAYPRNASAARAIAEDYLDADRVLTSLLERL